MKKLTQGEIVLKVLEESGDWIYGYNLIKVNTPFGWLGSSGDRAARTLAENGTIDRKHDGKYALYKVFKKEQSALFELHKNYILS